MPNYDFKKDIKISLKTEREVSKLFYAHYGWETIEFRADNKYELLLFKNNRILKRDFIKITMLKRECFL